MVMMALKDNPRSLTASFPSICLKYFNVIKEMKSNSEAFTDTLRRETARAHSLSDALVQLRLVSVLIDRELYAKALACFYFILQKIEDLLQQISPHDARVAAFVKQTKGLWRTSAIEKDLQFFLGPSWHDIASDSSKRYVQNYLNHLENSMPSDICIVIHAYTQFAAFASGGRILARLLVKSLFDNDSKGKPRAVDSISGGLHAFQYPHQNVEDLKNEMKCALNALEPHLSERERADMLREHAMVFALNNDVVRSFKVGFIPSAKAYSQLVYRKVQPIICSKRLVIGCAVLAVGMILSHRFCVGADL